MNAEAATLAVIDALEALRVEYMLVGSFSSNYYGLPRSTQDADFVVEFRDTSIRTVLERLGAEFQLDPQMSFESVTATRRYIVLVAGTGFRIEFFLLSEDDHDGLRFRRRRRVTLLGREVFLPAVEDVIITKLRWLLGRGSAKDVDDLRNVIAVQHGRIDWDYVHAWCDRHGTRAVLESIRNSLPPE